MPKTVLKVENLSVKLGEEKIIKNLNFEAKEGEVLVILGPNGAGKTTLLKALLGILPCEGKISWDTKNINYLPPQELLGRKYLPPLTIDEFFKFKKVSKEKILDTLKIVGLDSSVLKKSFGALSTGQFQRMMIAWALVDDPTVLLFDEPTAGIDIGGEETIYTLLHKFWEERNLTVLLVTHDLSIVWEHADNVLCLNKEKLCHGQVEKILTPENLEKLYGTGIKFYKHGHRTF